MRCRRLADDESKLVIVDFYEKVMGKRKPIIKLNKCDYCDLNRTVQPTTKQQIEELDKWFKDIDYLYKAKLIPHKYSKSILLPEQTTSYCLISSKYWYKKTKKCPFWQATIGANPDSAISIHLTRKILKINKMDICINHNYGVYWLGFLIDCYLLVSIKTTPIAQPNSIKAEYKNIHLSSSQLNIDNYSPR